MAEADQQPLVTCPVCEGEGFTGGMGTASTCVFCLGTGEVSADESESYDPDDALRGAEPTLERLQILIYQLDPWQRSRKWLEHYGFTPKQLEAELDRDEVNRLWGFDGRNLDGDEFLGHDWTRCDFSGSSLVEADFHEVDLADSNFKGADLSGADLTGTNLSRVSFGDANLSGAKIDAANLFQANLAGASLRGASLKGADLTETRLSNADVSGADFSGATNLAPSAVADLRNRGAILDESGH